MVSRYFHFWHWLYPTIVLFFLCVQPVDAAEQDAHASLEQLLQDIRQRVEATHSVRSAFEQERNLSLFTQPILFNGKMALVRPGKLRWENIEPIPSVLIFNGDGGIRCNDDAEPVRFELNKDPIMKMVAEQIWTWIDGDYMQMQDRYEISLVREMAIRLVPLSSEFADVIESVTVEFDKENLQPRTILVMETEGDSTRIRFSDYRLNETIDDTLFSVCYP